MNTKKSHVILLTFLLIQFGCSQQRSPASSVENNQDAVIFLLRHAEKENLSRDPELSSKGKERAVELVEVLRSAQLEHIHSTDFIRTRETAAPIAKKFGLTTEIYDPRDLKALIAKIKQQGGRHLVVGHSNTTPAMVELLVGKPEPIINEKSEFDRLYIVTLASDGSANSILMRYGKAYESD